MQIRSKARGDGGDKGVRGIVSLILKALALAMGIAVLVLSILKAIDLYSGFIMLGLGLTCAGLSLLSEKDKNA